LKKLLKYTFKIGLDVLFAVPLLVVAVVSRFVSKSFDIGMGPEPLISYLYHQRSLALKGFSSETFVIGGSYITHNFDFNADQQYAGIVRLFRWHLLFIRAVFRYRCLYFSFHGGPLMGTGWLRIVEPYLLKIAGIKVLILPYGSDVQDMTRCPNIAFTSALAKDYPLQRSDRQRIARQIDRWTRHADHILAGCDWVDYLYYWDTVALNNFSIDTDLWKLNSQNQTSASTIKILHSPNHRNVKGTVYFQRAVEELKQEGLDVELVILEKSSNETIRRFMAEIDIVADQLIIGWYAMFAMEGMALEKPVLCYIRPDLLEYYTDQGLLLQDELPIVNCNTANVKAKIRELVESESLRREIGIRSRNYILKHHSLEAIAENFDKMNQAMNLQPSGLINHE